MDGIGDVPNSKLYYFLQVLLIRQRLPTFAPRAYDFYIANYLVFFYLFNFLLLGGWHV